MRTEKTNRGAALAAGVAGLIALASAGAAETPARVDFAHDVAPLIKARCAKCHADGTYKGSFSFDTRESTLKSESIVPGKSAESELVERLRSADPEFRMPPEGKRLSAAEVARFERWIDQGLPWE